MTTTTYGSWTKIEMQLTVEDGIAAALGEHADAYDVEAIATDYRAAINAALPDGVSLHGDEFYGPADAGEWDGYPATEDGGLDLKAIVASVDFWSIATEHEE